MHDLSIINHWIIHSNITPILFSITPTEIVEFRSLFFGARAIWNISVKIETFSSESWPLKLTKIWYRRNQQVSLLHPNIQIPGLQPDNGSCRWLWHRLQSYSCHQSIWCTEKNTLRQKHSQINQSATISCHPNQHTTMGMWQLGHHSPRNEETPKVPSWLCQKDVRTHKISSHDLPCLNEKHSQHETQSLDHSQTGHSSTTQIPPENSKLANNPPHQTSDQLPCHSKTWN